MNFEIQIICEQMEKTENEVECCICLEIEFGVKLPNCNHFVCPKCYYKLYYGYLSDAFHSNNPCPVAPQKPIYPYLDVIANLEIFHNLINKDMDKDWFVTEKDWFISENEDLYNCIKKSECVDYVDINVKKWFENNAQLAQYENDVLQYELDNIKYSNQQLIYSELCKEEIENNTQNRCPMCRL
jgi:hypothetical protein